MKKRWIFCLLVVAMVLGMLSACGGSDGTKETESSGAISGIPDTETGEVVFTYARKETPQSMDIWGQSNVCNYIFFNLIYDQLICLDVVSGKYTPGLATEWTVSDDGCIYEFKIREGVKFHNGEDCTASDVVCNFQRVIDDTTLTRANLFSAMTSVEAVNDYTVRFTLSEANGYFMNLLAQFPGAIPADYYAEKNGDIFNENYGTGPWKFVSWDVSTGEMVFERNDAYWGECTSNVDIIKYVAISEDATRVAAVRTGDVDMADGIPADYLSNLESEGVAYDRTLAYDQIYAQFQNNGIFSDINARMAFNYAIDREAICAGIVMAGQAATWPTIEGTIGYSDTAEYAYKQDMEKAKDYLAKSSYNGEEIRLIGPQADYDHITEVLTAIYGWMTEAGFNVKLEQLQSAAFTAARKGGEYDIYITGSTWTQGDGYIFLNQRVLGDSFSSNFAIPEVNNAIVESNSKVDYAERDAALRTVYEKMMENSNMSFIYTLEAIVAYQPNVKNVVFWGDKHTELRNVIVE